MKCLSLPCLLALLATALLLQGCSGTLPLRDPERPAGRAPSTAGTRLALLAADARAGHSDQSGFHLLDKGEEALLWRVALADAAEKTLDLQYYIWQTDKVGAIIAGRVLRAAERGVRVRLLLDDIPLKAAPRHLALMNAHPNIEIRIYNPLGRRSDRTARFSNILWNFSRLNRRMHNKVFVADGAAAILGGRNIGDEYFDMHAEFNFRDIDVLAIGPIVNDISVSFDTYWHSNWVYPVDRLLPDELETGDRAEFYAAVHRHTEQANIIPKRFQKFLDKLEGRLEEFFQQFQWGPAELICDKPGKNEDVERLDAFSPSGERLAEIAMEVEKEIIAETPYLLMMPITFDILSQLNRSGVDIKVVTNSLETTDIIGVHAGYAKQRKRMLRLGVELYELKPEAEIRYDIIARYRKKTMPPLSLHAKAAVLDRNKVFIGSFNLDPRSAHLNTEIGLLISNIFLAEQVRELLMIDARPENSWRLELDTHQNLSWHGRVKGKLVVKKSDPNKNIARSLKFLLYSIVPLSSLL
jgi:cardiolipin synthase C